MSFSTKSTREKLSKQHRHKAYQKFIKAKQKNPKHNWISTQLKKPHIHETEKKKKKKKNVFPKLLLLSKNQKPIG